MDKKKAENFGASFGEPWKVANGTVKDKPSRSEEGRKNQKSRKRAYQQKNSSQPDLRLKLNRLNARTSSSSSSSASSSASSSRSALQMRLDRIKAPPALKEEEDKMKELIKENAALKAALDRAVYGVQKEDIDDDNYCNE